MSDTSKDEAAVLAADDVRLAAMVKQDFAAMGSVLADDLVYVHTTTRLDTKESLAELLRTKEVQYHSAKRGESVVKIYGDTAIMNGLMTFEVERANVKRIINCRYMNVWMKKNGQWQMKAVASVPIPPPAPPAR